MIIVGSRIEARVAVKCAVLFDYTEATTEAMQDKNPHLAAVLVDCFDCYFPDFLHIAPLFCDVHSFILLSDFSRSRTLQVFSP
ncbi:hypothetical protein ACUSIJ_14410 [Pseudochelatococcus sp. B33]